jgi:hypothetical protein
LSIILKGYNSVKRLDPNVEMDRMKNIDVLVIGRSCLDYIASELNFGDISLSQRIVQLNKLVSGTLIGGKGNRDIS